MEECNSSWDPKAVLEVVFKEPTAARAQICSVPCATSAGKTRTQKTRRMMVCIIILTTIIIIMIMIIIICILDGTNIANIMNILHTMNIVQLLQ